MKNSRIIKHISHSIIIIPILIQFLSAQNYDNAFKMRPAPPDGYNEIQKNIFNKVNDRYHIYSGIVVGVNTDGQVIEFNTELINNGLTATNPIERAYQFFENNKDLILISDPRKEMVVSRVVCNEDGSGSVQFEQVVGGVKVYLSGCSVFFDKSGTQLTRFTTELSGSGLLPDAHTLNLIPSIDSLQAAHIAKADAYKGENVGSIFGGLWIADHWNWGRKFQDGNIHLAWRICAGENWYFIDAYTGKILSRERNFVY
jgi:Zn-dependent metalloprotease